jgi:hypothetical protein
MGTIKIGLTIGDEKSEYTIATNALSSYYNRLQTKEINESNEINYVRQPEVMVLRSAFYHFEFEVRKRLKLSNQEIEDCLNGKITSIVREFTERECDIYLMILLTYAEDKTHSEKMQIRTLTKKFNAPL